MSTGRAVISVSISIVTFYTAQEEFEELITHLGTAINTARKSLEGAAGDISLTVIDNSCNRDVYERLSSYVKLCESGLGARVSTIKSSANIGYGAAHNVALKEENSTFHLVLNPDVLLSPEVLVNGLHFMLANSNIGLLSPKVVDSQGERSFLCKRYPTVFDLFLRGFAPLWLKRNFQRRLDHYEMRDQTRNETQFGIPIVSGCFMLFRTDVLKQLNGFDERYFMYFEDFDICMRMHGVADIAYVPSVSISHSGGDAARKGVRHIVMFITSAFRFFSRWGWKWW